MANATATRTEGTAGTTTDNFVVVFTHEGRLLLTPDGRATMRLTNDLYMKLADELGGSLPKGARAYYFHSEDGTLPQSGRKVDVLKAMYKKNGGIFDRSPMAVTMEQFSPRQYVALVLNAAAAQAAK